jgi:hypothetical protein
MQIMAKHLLLGLRTKVLFQAVVTQATPQMMMP